jgi:cyclic pyranopterin monophosphate synthase
MSQPTHWDEAGRAQMVDVGRKPVTHRRATAEAVVAVSADIMARVRAGQVPKGDVFETARLAGIMAAKRTAELIPLCHNIAVDHVTVEIEPGAEHIRIVASAAALAATGVEMEALTAAAVAGLTVYDMLKSLSHGILLERVRLLSKSGGQSGEYFAPDGPSGRRTEP